MDSVSKILFNFFIAMPIIIIMILIMKILLHNEYKIINLWYPTYVYQFFNFTYNYKNRVLVCFQTRPQVCSMEHCSQTLPLRHLESNWRCAPSSLNPAIRHCWKHLQHPGAAWGIAPWGHCPLFHGEELHRVD